MESRKVRRFCKAKITGESLSAGEGHESAMDPTTFLRAHWSTAVESLGCELCGSTQEPKNYCTKLPSKATEN